MTNDPDLLRKEFLDAIRRKILYWDKQKISSCKEKMEGLIHSVLCLIDGVSCEWDGCIDLIARIPLDDIGDKEDKVAFNKDCYLHESWYKK